MEPPDEPTAPGAPPPAPLPDAAAPAPAHAAPRRPPGSPLGFFAVVLGLYVTLGTASQSISAPFGLAWTQLFVFLVPAAISAAAANLSPARALLFARPPPRGTVLAAIAIGVVAFFGAGATMALVAAFLPRSWVKAFDLAPLFQTGPLARLVLAAIASVLAPLCEEAAFRGHVQTLLGARLRPPGAIALTALLFAVMHLDPVRFLAVLQLGLLYGWLAWRSGSVWPSIAAHAANNLIGSALVVSSSRATVDVEQAQPLASLFALALALLALAPLLSLYRRLTPAPPAMADALAPADAADPGPRFAWRRVPSRLLRLAWAGVALLAAAAAVRLALR